MSEIKLFDNKKDCCACGACVNVCPKDAIEMREDEYGFLYPYIDESKCIKCGKCVKTCAYKKKDGFCEPSKVYAGASVDKEILEKAASGGIFSTLAEKVLEEDGVVFGAAMMSEDENLITKHIFVDNIKDLHLLQGSKYVQSNIGNAYKKVEEFLKQGRTVMFSGTPCQIAGLRAMLKIDYDKLITVDVICHGVPNYKWFQDYITVMTKKISGKITQYVFRDKTCGQGMNTKIIYTNCQGHEQKYIIDGYLTSYFYYFLKSFIYRENCYSCPYARKERVSDITIGDYWGIYQVHPQEMKKVKMSNDTGVSCILINSDKGNGLIEKVKERLETFESTYEKVALNNEQLKKPCDLPSEREILMKLYREKGFEAIDEYYYKNTVKQRFFHKVKSKMPKSFKRRLKSILCICGRN